ncbi:GntR family transcriptional regulator [Variovorax sp. Sphag1AA]|uniref:GntR family transcriptional regulator n=1 Tax=Variovorax sp. Sphag1AA TaxID=2587027 RepID=UPI001613F106|nr:GntR family transcriptional regulator [Variovorax sp. Sphag1AA]MBB3175995.1 DNA-binding GntR family transcriptional regulator [Variovorax sp. Sphag1AA]
MRKRTGTDLIAGDVHQKLRSKILTLEIKPGARLVEDEISSLLEAGRTPVREALLRLQGEGLVSRDRGWVVESTDPSSFRAIFESRIAIEGYATRLAAERATPAALDDLQQLVDEMDRGESLPRSEINRLNQTFHRTIVALSENPFFVELHERTQFRYWNLRLPVIFLKDQLAHSAEQHKAILAAMKNRNGDLAERVTREHIETTMNIVADALSDN